MDHILEHEGQAVPDLSSTAPSGGMGPPMDVDDDDEAEASLIGKSGADLEAKVLSSWFAWFLI